MRSFESCCARFIPAMLFVATLPWSSPLLATAKEPAPLADTAPLPAPLDAAKFVAEIDRFLTEQIAQAAAEREARWSERLSNSETAAHELPRLRKRLQTIIGAVDERERSLRSLLGPDNGPPCMYGLDGDSNVHTVSRRVLASDDGAAIYGIGIIMGASSMGDSPQRTRAHVILIPDADQTPEALLGLSGDLPPEAQIARRLTRAGYEVFIPLLISRDDTHSVVGERKTNQPHREFVYRQAYELGRHIIGYEVQMIRCAIDDIRRTASGRTPEPPIVVMGYGEGGLIALYAAACDERIDICAVSGHFGPRENLWQEPIYRNVWDLLTEFGDAELAALIAPRQLIIEAAAVPEIDGPPPVRDGRSGAAPGQIRTPALADIQSEATRARRWYEQLIPGSGEKVSLVVSSHAGGEPGTGPAFSDAYLQVILAAATPGTPLPPAATEPIIPPQRAHDVVTLHPSEQQRILLTSMVNYTQSLLRSAEQTRRQYWQAADSSSQERWQETTAPYRTRFYDEAIGRFDIELLPPAARSRQVFDEPKYVGYEVELDVFPGLTAQGILLMPRGIAPGERRPVVVCQHGLEGRPHDLADPAVENAYYEQYGCRLAERGFIVFAPQNPYIGRDAFRVLQRKANPLGKSLFSIIVPQHQAIVNWLASRPEADPQRIAFYGLSYGGKTAMRVPPLVDGYCLSICSADFNEWIWKNASATSPYSYLATGEYEIFEWNLGNTFNYAEMASLIAPRPFMVERGHFDGVAPDEQVAYEYAKVRRLYAILGIPERTEIEFFAGPHKIHGVGTFDFLHRHLKWSAP